jgi:hypothetical protein
MAKREAAAAAEDAIAEAKEDGTGRRPKLPDL